MGLTYECLESLDQLILQSSKGFHILFEKEDIVEAFGSHFSEDLDMEKLKKIQEVLYKFMSLKGHQEKRVYLKTLEKEDYVLLIRAYFKIVDNTMLGRLKKPH